MTATQTQNRTKERPSEKRKIHWPETVLPPINLWNAPLLEHHYRGKNDHASH